MKIRVRSIGTVILFVLTSPAWSNSSTKGLVSAQTINKPSIQINLRAHIQWNFAAWIASYRS